MLNHKQKNDFIAPRPEEPSRTSISTPVLGDPGDGYDSSEGDDYDPSDIGDAPPEPPRGGTIMLSDAWNCISVNGYRDYHAIKGDLPMNPLMFKQCDTETIE